MLLKRSPPRHNNMPGTWLTGARLRAVRYHLKATSSRSKRKHFQIYQLDLLLGIYELTRSRMHKCIFRLKYCWKRAVF